MIYVRVKRDLPVYRNIAGHWVYSITLIEKELLTKREYEEIVKNCAFPVRGPIKKSDYFEVVNIPKNRVHRMFGVRLADVDYDEQETIHIQESV